MKILALTANIHITYQNTRVTIICMHVILIVVYNLFDDSTQSHVSCPHM